MARTVCVAIALGLVVPGGCVNPRDLQPNPVPHATDTSGRFTPAALQQDWDVLAGALRTHHAGLSLFLPRAEFERRVSEVRAGLTHPQSTLEVLPHVADLIARLCDRHTVCRPPEAGDALDLAPSSQRRLLPLDVLIDGSQAFVLRNASGDTRLSRGAEVLRIDGRPIAEVLMTLRRLSPADGLAEAGRDRDIERDFPAYYYFYIDRPAEFHVTARPSPAGSPFEAVIPALAEHQRRTAMAAAGDELPETAPGDASQAPAVYELHWGPDEESASLRILTFARRPYRETGRHVEHVYDEVFDQLAARGIRRLLLDLRDNPGGRTEYMRELLSYFMPRPRAELLYQARSASGERGVVWLPRPESEAYHGLLAVLVNAGTGSAAAQLAEALRECAGAVVYGEETGSRADGFTAGSFVELELPNTRIAVSIPQWEYRLVISDVEHGRPVMPDVLIAAAVQERLFGPDRQAARAMEALRSLTPRQPLHGGRASLSVQAGYAPVTCAR